MVGFIKGILGSKPKAAEAAPEVVETPVAQPNSKPQAFFLEPDDAKTFGDIDYMRTAKKVRRTFPKTVSTGSVSEKEYIVSALSMEVASQFNPTLRSPEPTSAEAPAATPAQADVSVERRRTDTSMDMFRNMARDIKKR